MDIGQRPHRDEPMMTSDFNDNLEGPKGNNQDEDIATAMAPSGPKDISDKFLPLQNNIWVRDRRTWSTTHLGQEVRYRME